MNYIKIKYPDVANGPGVRVSLFTAGCFRRCPGCFNPETWDLRAGEQYTSETEEELLQYLDRPEVAGLSILGGEPLLLSNLPAVYSLVKRAKMKHPDKPVWIWTGNTYEDMALFCRQVHDARRLNNARHQLSEILREADVLVDGPYIEDERDLTLKFRGSRNQRIIDLQKSKPIGGVVLWKGVYDE